MHKQQKPVMFEKLFVSMTGLFPSAQYLEAEGTMVNGGRTGNINQIYNLLQRHVHALLLKTVFLDTLF